MRSALLRTPAVRQLTARRFASSTPNPTSEVSAKAQDAGKKAQDVAKVVVEKLGTAASGLGKSLMKVGGRTGKMIHSANGECGGVYPGGSWGYFLEVAEPT